MAYRAEIEIGVKGVQQLTQLQKRLEGTAYKIEEINKKQATVFGGLAQSIKNYTRQLNMAEEALFNVAAGTAQETRAVRNYVDALGNANAIRARQNDLIRDEIELKRQAALASKGIRETTQYAGPIGPGQASSILGGQSMPAGGRIQRILNARQDELKLQEALLRLEEKSAAELNEKVQAQQNLVAGTQEVFSLLQRQAGLSQYAQPLPIPGGLKTEQVLAVQAAKRTENLAIEQRLQRTAASTVTQYNLQLGILRQMAEIGKKINESTQQELVNQRRLNRVLRVRQGREFQRRRREATGSAIIGGAFPLLFGQGIGAAAGGGLGGIAGGALGGQFGFGLSLVGTAVGQAIDTLSAELSKLAKSLKTPSEALTALEEAGIKVADSSRQQIKQLEEAGRVYDAQTVLFAEIAARLGTNAVNQLNALNDASEDLQNEFSVLKGQILSDLLPAVVLATRAFADIVAILNNVQVPQSLLDLAVGTAAGTILPGGLPPGLLGAGVRGVTGTLVPGTAPDRSDALDRQNRLNRATQNRIELLEQERQLLNLSDDLLDDAVYKAREKAINTEWQKKEQNLILEGKGNEEKITDLILERDRKLKKLADDRNRAQERINKQREREAEIAAREAQRAAEAAAREAQRAFEAGEKLQTEQERRIKILMLESDLEKELLRIENARVDAIKRIADIAPGQQPQATAQANTLAQMEAGFAIGESLAKGVLGEDRLRQAREDALRPLEQERALLEARINGTEDEERLRQRINDIIRQTTSLDRERVEELVRGNAELEKQAKQPNLIRDLSAQVKQLQDELNPVKLATETIINGAFAIGDAFSQAFVDVISGAKSTEEALADAFESIGKAFLGMAAEIIAKQLTLIALQTILKALGLFAGGGGGGGLSGGLGGLPATSNVPFTGSMPFTGFADGGTVMPGNTYMVGERGPELLQLNRNGSGQVINNNQLSSAMNRYRRSGTTATNESAAMMQGGEGGTAVLDKPIDVRYTVERINNVDYVTTEQFQQGMQQAAQRGAAEGQQRTLRALKQNTTQRKQIGL